MKIAPSWINKYQKEPLIMSEVMENEEIEVNTKTLVGMFNDVTTVKRSGAGRPTAKKDQEALVNQLKEKDNFILRSLLQANFSERVKFPFPPGQPPFNKNEEEVEVTDDMIRILGRCTFRGNAQVIEQEKTFISLLESIHEDDAELLCLVKDRKLEEKYPQLTKEVVEQAWENLV